MFNKKRELLLWALTIINLLTLIGFIWFYNGYEGYKDNLFREWVKEQNKVNIEFIKDYVSTQEASN